MVVGITGAFAWFNPSAGNGNACPAAIPLIYDRLFEVDDYSREVASRLFGTLRMGG